MTQTAGTAEHLHQTQFSWLLSSVAPEQALWDFFEWQLDSPNNADSNCSKAEVIVSVFGTAARRLWSVAVAIDARPKKRDAEVSFMVVDIDSVCFFVLFVPLWKTIIRPWAPSNASTFSQTGPQPL